MRNVTRLHKLFAAALAIAPVACSSASSGVDRSHLHDDLCNGTGRFDELAGVTPATPVDYLELRESFGGTTSPDTIASKNGTPCATAKDMPKCQASLASLKTTKGWVSAPSGGDIAKLHYAVFTRGDTVDVVDTLDGLRAFLSPVDDIHDAAFLVAENNFAVECGGSSAGAVSGGFEVLGKSGNTCGGDIRENRVFVGTDGNTVVRESVVVQAGDPHCAIGRRPENLRRSVDACADGEMSRVGAFFAKIAHLEAASVFAFERLGRELRAHGAPERLVRACERSRKEEIRHARVTTELSRAYDAQPEEPCVGDLPIRGLFDVALENAVEGCVRETFGALIALHQKTHASDPRIALAMHTIAEDETRHAALSWDIAEWIEPLLTTQERATLGYARALAAKQLRSELAAEIDPTVIAIAGMPTPAAAVQMFDAIAPSIWG